MSATAAGIMALCIGACVAVFSMVKAVILTDPAYQDSGRIGVIWHARPNMPGNIGMSPSDLRSYQGSLQTFESVAAVTTRGVNLGGAIPSRAICARMTANMFPLLGVAPARGRWFTADEERDAATVVVVSHQFWLSRLGGDARVLGRDIAIDAIPRRIVGVMPAAFVFPLEGIQGLSKAECWLPASYSKAELVTPSFNHVLIGRLKSGVTWEQARADAHAGAQRIWASYPAAVQSQITLTARVVPLTDQTLGAARLPLALLAGAVLSLLVIGCANVSNLLLLAFDARRQELQVRISVGATRTSIVAQLICESIALALIGGLVGAILAHGILKALIAINSSAFPRLSEARVDVASLSIATLTALMVGIVGAIAPAFAAKNEYRSVDGRGRTIARGFAGTLWGRVTIGVQLMLAVVLLTLAAFLFRSIVNLNGVGIGLAAQNAITFSVALPESAYAQPGRASAFRDGVIDRLNHVPGVAAVAASSALPIGETIPGVVAPAGSASPADYHPSAVYAVTPSFVRATGMTVTSGRFFEERDAADAALAVVNESLARTMWPARDAIGKSVTLLGQSRSMMIIGVVGDVRQTGPLRPAAPAIYQLISQTVQPIRTQHFIFQSTLPLASLSDDVRLAVASVDAEIPIFGLRTIRNSITNTTASQRFYTLIAGLFAAVALILTLCGVYAIFSQSVESARRDFGIRQALGATRAGIARMVLLQAMWPTSVGISGGMIASMATSELIASLLFGVKPNDSTTIGAIAVLTLIASIAAVLAPALRAARIDPVSLLRSE